MLLATLAGLAVAVWAFGEAGIAGVVTVARRLGIGGFLLYCLYSIGVFAILGGAWLAAAPGEPNARLPLFAWARMVREAVADLLPFSQIGGIVVGTRVLTDRGIGRSRVYGSMIADMTTEIASQLIFTLFGLATIFTALFAGGASAEVRPFILGGAGLMTAMVIGLIAAQRAVLRLAAAIARRVLPGSASTAEETGQELARIYAHRGRIALAFMLNLAGWVASAGGAWVALRLMGVPFPLVSALALESLVFTLRSVAFAIPGAIGVQEATYALAAPLLGLPPHAALALALAKRARDLGVGLPTLLAWQAGEMRSVLRSGSLGADRPDRRSPSP